MSLAHTCRFRYLQGAVAGVGVFAMLLALLTAPLTHSHDQDDHGRHETLVHAHFLESESPSHSRTQFEEQDSHHDARWLDVFTFNHAPRGFDLAIEAITTFTVPVLEEQPDIVFASEPQAHGPPALCSSVPRSPPSV